MESTVDLKRFKPILYVGEGSTHFLAWLLLSIIWLAFIPIGISQDKSGMIIFGIVMCAISYFIGLIYTQVFVKKNPILLEKARMREIGVIRFGKIVDVIEDWHVVPAFVIMDILSVFDGTSKSNPYMKYVYYIIEYYNADGQRILLKTARVSPKGNLGRHGRGSLDTLVIGKTVLIYEYNGKAFADKIEKIQLF